LNPRLALVVWLAISGSTARASGAFAATPWVAVDSLAGRPDSTAAAPTIPAPDTTTVREQAPDRAHDAEDLASKLVELGLENVSADASSTPPRVGFENRRYRHTLEALARAEAAAGGRVTAFERRLGLLTAAITTTGPDSAPRFHVRYPSDRDFPAAPAGPRRHRTSRSLDLIFGPLLSYEIGHVYQPEAFQIQAEPRLRYNPWPGAVANASLFVPLYNDFPIDDAHPDVEQVRPGLVNLSQYAWLPKVALISASAGLFDDNRYGWSFGAARPLFEGAVLLDVQADYTGFVAFPSDGMTYSPLENSSSFAGITWRVPWWDVSLRLRGAQFLYGDRGEEFNFTRTMGDVDFSIFGVRSDGIRVEGVRITLPIPPMTRGTSHAIRVQPVERFPFSYRTDTDIVGHYLSGAASREDFLRQLSAPSLDANRDRYREARGEKSPDPGANSPDWVSLNGTTGFINTPWAESIRDRTIELSYSDLPKKWAYGARGAHEDQVYALTVGILPRVEGCLRFTRIPGLKGFNPELVDPDNLLNTDTDHMASGRLTILTAKGKRPAVAIGMDDVEGTRRFHSTYVVVGSFFSILRVQNRLSLGYAPSVFTATRLVLDGGFGAIEVSPWRAVAARVEYDTEKWNAGLGVELGFGFQLHVAALNMESLSIGAGWRHSL
jgi:hypothetical protein